MSDASRYGTLTCDAAGRLLVFAEKQPGAGVINAGVYLFRRRLLARFPAHRPLSFETDVFPRLIPDCHIQTMVVDAPFIDIGTPASLVQAETFISNHLDRFAL